MSYRAVSRQRSQAVRRGGTGGPTQGDRGLPTIISNDRYLPEVSEDILNAIIQQNDPPVVFRRGPTGHNYFCRRQRARQHC